MKIIKNIIKNYLAFSFLVLIFLASSYYLLQSGFFYVHDFTIAARIAEMARIIEAGHFPPRWSANFGYGFGMPLFNFYAPLPYIVAALVLFLNNNLIFVIKFLYLLINFFTLWGSFKLGKRLNGLAGGLVLAALFTLAPYRALLLFVRGALSEAFALSFFPWATLAVINISKSKKIDVKSYLLLFLSLLGIVLSHNLSALMFIPLLFTIALLIANKKRLKILLTFISAGLATSFYIIPSFFEQDLTRVNAIFSDYFDYRLHFVYIRQLFWDNWAYGGSAWGVNDDISFFLGFAQLLALFILIVLIGKKIFLAIKAKNLKKVLIKTDFSLSILLFIFFLVSLFLSLQKSQFIWSILAILSYLQFPWRWFGPSFFFLASSFAASLFLIKNTLLKYLLVIFVILLSLVNFSYFRAEKIITNFDNIYTGQETLIASTISQTLPDYIPIQMAEQKILQKFNQQHPQPLLWSTKDEENLFDVEIFDAHLEKNKSNQQIWSLTLEDDKLVNFKVANYPGWQAIVNEQEVEILTNPQLGNIQLNLKTGDNHIELNLKENRVHRFSNSLSLLSFLAFITWLYWQRKKNSNL